MEKEKYFMTTNLSLAFAIKDLVGQRYYVVTDKITGEIKYSFKDFNGKIANTYHILSTLFKRNNVDIKA